MTAKKQKEKDRRRARKLADQAWDAAHEDNLDLACKIIRRAVATQPDNPVLWNDQGVLLTLQGKVEEAEQSFRSALSLAPDFADPHAQLAAIRVRQGLLREAVGLQMRAAQLAPSNSAFSDRLVCYQALVAQEAPVRKEAVSTETVRPAESAVPTTLGKSWADDLAARDWRELEDRLTHDGYAVAPRLLDAETCAALSRLIDDDSLFAKTVVMDQKDFGLGTYRYFRPPIPETVEELRRTVYPQVARIGNRWQQLLREPTKYPETWEMFREEYHRAGQATSTPILLKYGPGGFNALHRDIRGKVYFPIQMAVVLSHRVDADNSDGFTGGEFLFCDVPQRNKSRHRAIDVSRGDAILFATRDRLVPIGGVYGLQPVKHGVAPIVSGTRVVLGVPFHEYR